jgi:hypothetical protein
MMNRRRLLAGALKVTGAGALSAMTARHGLAGMTGQARTAGNGQKDALKEPVRTKSLRTAELEIVFDADRGVPYRYTYAGGMIGGDDVPLPLKATVCVLHPRSYATVYTRPMSVEMTHTSAYFHFEVKYGKLKAAAFCVRYAVDGATVQVTMDSVEEHTGFQLIDVTMPRLVSVSERDGAGWMAQGRNGGSFVELAKAKAYSFPEEQFFGHISTQTPIGMVGVAGIGCVMEVQAFMDGTLTSIAGGPGSRVAKLGTIQNYRVNGGGCYSMNDGGPPICGNSGTPNLLVEQASSTRLDFFKCGNEAQPWMTGAKIVRARTPPSPTEYYSDKLAYIIAGKDKIEKKPRTTFAQSHALVHDVARLTDQAPQVVFLGGWDYNGQDTGFPSEDRVNASLGSYADLRRLMTDAAAWNANVTLNVNYDDAYKSSPIFNTDFIARRPDGQIWKSRAWDGETSYIVGMAKFMEGGWGDRRIEYTVARYKIHDALLIDALSWYAIRNDWDPQHPASGYVNLVKGKYPLLKKARSLGINVASELFRYPFLGKLALTMNGPEEGNCPFGGEAVPLAAILYRKSAIWGNAGKSTYDPSKDLFWNNRSAIWYQADSDRAKLADFYFLVTLPFAKLHRLAVESYAAEGTRRVLTLEDSSRIERDTTSRAYSAVWKGVEIARDDATFCPIDEDRVAFYTREAKELRYPLPEGWAATDIVARSLSLSGRTEFPVQVKAGELVVNAPARIPVIVYRQLGAIKDV